MKNLKAICLLFVCIICIALATSCKNDVEEIESASDKKMSSVDSYTSKTTFEMSVKKDDTEPINLNLSATTKMVNANNDNYAYGTSTTTKIKEWNETAESLRLLAYQNGYMYDVYTVDTLTNTLKAPSTPEEFEDFLYSQDEAFWGGYEALNEKNAYKTEVVEHENGCRTVTMSDFSEEITSSAESLVELLYDYTDSKAENIIVTIEFNPDYSYNKATMDFVFTDSSDGSIANAKMETVYYDYNSTEWVELAFAQECLVDDITVIYEVSDAIDEMLKNRSGKFTSTIKEDYYSRIIENAASWSNEDGNFSFEVVNKSNAGDEVITTTYSDGVLKESRLHSEYKNSQRIKTTRAKAALEQLFFGATFSPLYISDVDIVEDGRIYTFHMAYPGYGSYELTVKLVGDHISSVNACKKPDSSWTSETKLIEIK